MYREACTRAGGAPVKRDYLAKQLYREGVGHMKAQAKLYSLGRPPRFHVKSFVDGGLRTFDLLVEEQKRRAQK